MANTKEPAMHRLHLAATLFGLLFGSSAHAVGSLADFTIYDRTEGRTLPVYRYAGEYYVAGKPGNEYRVQVRNQNGGDLLAVVSVDGVNVVSGETAHWRQSGYVVDGWQSLSIDGWRKSLDRTAAFYFTRLPDSYAARTDRPENVGVIGVALFQRKVEPVAELTPAPVPYEDETRDAAPASARAEADANSAGSSAGKTRAAQPSLQNEMKKDRGDTRLGTGHGRSETSYASYTNFERASEEPVEIIAIHYDSRRNLIAMGVIPEERAPLPVAVNPFPGSFVPDPPR
jgi:hypothetical protein